MDVYDGPMLASHQMPGLGAGWKAVQRRANENAH